MSKPSRTRLRPALGAVALTALALVLAACSSSSSASSSSPAGVSSSSAGAAGTSPSGTPIKIGLIGTLSGALESAGGAGGTVGPAWAKWVNANGGINGHPVDLIVKDDAGSAATGAQVAQELISDGVVAIIASSDYTVTSYEDKVTAAGIPLISGTANVPDWFTKTGMFPVAGHDSEITAQVTIAKTFGHAKSYANVYCAEVASCLASVAPQAPVAKGLGLAFTSLALSSTAPSYTAQCLSLKQKGVDYLELNIPDTTGAKFLADCAQQGYQPTVGTSAQGIGQNVIAVQGAVGYGPSEVFPTVASAPLVAQYRSAMQKYASNDNWHYGTAPFTWAGLQLLRQVLAGISGTPTSANVLAGLYQVKGDNLGGLVPNKLTYTAGKPTPSSDYPCNFTLGFKNGQVTAPSGLQPQCGNS